MASSDFHENPAMRASDADRDAVAQRLASALSEGRLDLQEYEERLDRTMSAKTHGELVPLTADLPVEQEQPAQVPAQQGSTDVDERSAGPAAVRRKHLNEWRDWAGGATIMIGIWGVTSVMAGGFHAFWPAIPLGIWAVILLAGLIMPDRDRQKGC